jgi:hypothetical protein
MTHLTFFWGPSLLALAALAALLHEHHRRPRPRTEADKKALAPLRSWLTPEQDKQWSARGSFEVVGCDTGTRYLLTYRPMMNVQELDPEGRPMLQWCFGPEGELAIGDMLLAQKIALETMERKALALANGQPVRVSPSEAQFIAGSFCCCRDFVRFSSP